MSLGLVIKDYRGLGLNEFHVCPRLPKQDAWATGQPEVEAARNSGNINTRQKKLLGIRLVTAVGRGREI